MARATARRTAPDLIVVGMDLEDGPLVQVIEDLRRESPSSRFVLFSETTEGLKQQELVRKGALLERALELGARGVRVESAAVQDEMMAESVRPPEPARAVELSERDRRVVAGLRAGHTQPQIGEDMDLSTRTIQDSCGI